MVVTRFAPSPTGSLHIGGVRTALYAFALARKNQGRFFLRIEDTDQNRFVLGSEAEIEKMLKAFGLHYDEKFKQSERLEKYQKYAKQLVQLGHAYYCFSTKEELEEMRNKAKEAGKNFVFRSPYRDLDVTEAEKRVAAGEPYVIRQKLPENHVVVFDDPVQGTMSFNTNDIDETVLLKSDGFPTYHLAVVIDDHEMQVSDVFRGVEWLPSLPKHVLLYKAFGWEMPVITHLPVILDPDGGKLSKRRGAVSAVGFLEEGYLPEAIINFLMLLGWSAPITYEHGEKEQEFFTLDAFVNMFSMKDLNKASPVFNRDKLLWFNQKYIQNLTADELSNKFIAWLQEYGKKDLDLLKSHIIKIGPDQLQKILLLEQTRIKMFSELPSAIAFYFEHNGGLVLNGYKQTKQMSDKVIQDFLNSYIQFLENYAHELNEMSHEIWETFVRDYAEKNELKAGSLFMLLRLAVTDSPFSPPLFEVMQILGKIEVVKRLKKYLQ